MDKFLRYLPVVLLILSGCSHTAGVGDRPNVTYYEGIGYISFQSEEYRLWLFTREWPGDTCKTNRLLIGLCREGLLSGMSFHRALDDTNRRQPHAPSFAHYDILDDDFERFTGIPTFIEEASVSAIRPGRQRDTVFIGLSVDLSGKLPGPMAVFRLALTCDKSSDPCEGRVDKPQVLSLTFEGMVL